jgi:hypothetical protein
MVVVEFSLGEFRELPQERLLFLAVEALEYLQLQWQQVFVQM